MPACKACEVMRKEAYICVRRRSAPQQTGVFQQPDQASDVVHVHIRRRQIIPAFIHQVGRLVRDGGIGRD